MADKTNQAFRPIAASPSMVDLVAHAVRDAILDGSMNPGSAISIAKLAEDFDVSHIPVREALQRLEAEGLLEFRRARQAVVAPIDVDEMRNIFRIRINLEGDLIERAAKAYSDSDLATLRLSLAGLEASEGDLAALREEHYDFHRQLVLPVASAWDLRVLDLLWRASDRYLQLIFRGYSQREEFVDLVALHKALLETATERSGPALRKGLTEHLHEGVRQIEVALREQESLLEGGAQSSTA
jgi:DNA-binding GntR family transcriptional regulator